VAVDGSGNAFVVWQRFDGANNRAQAAARSAGAGLWSTPDDLSAAGQDAGYPKVAVDGSGNAIAVWSRSDGSNDRVQAAVHPASSGVWGSVETLSAAGQPAYFPQVVFDGSGNAFVVWIRSDGSDYRVQVSVFDAVGPVLSDLAVPVMGTVGIAVEVSVAAVDTASGVASVTWDFGDGSPAVTGISVAHTFAGAGTYTVSVSVVDGVGNVSVLSSPVTVYVGCTIVGTPGDDVLFGTSGADHICGFGGDDKIYGRGGDDVLDGGPGNDVLKGAKGKDRLYGRGGRDALKGGPHDDKLRGGPHNDKLWGQGGKDKLRGGSHSDKLWGQGGKDKLWGQAGRDILSGGPKKDVLHGGKGKDTALNPGPDQLISIFFLS
jgi:Ca2+-binding RTX toxin-like protein